VKKELLFNGSGIFKILQFTDIHFTDDSETDHRTTGLMEKLIREEKPDFIISTGDTVYGPDNTRHIRKALAPILEAGVPWSYTFGNHDVEEGEGYDVLFPIITALPNCMMYHAEDSINGVGNHYLEVKNQKGETKWLLFGIDTGMYNKIPQVGGYDYIKDNQIKWYKKVIHDLEQMNKDFSSLVFMHMPLPEYHEVWEFETCYGEKREGIGCPRINSGFFAALQEAGHTKGVFAGHDHINDYIGRLYGISLAYGRATGYNTYGQSDFLRGARIIEIEENNTESFKTYLRLSDGTVVREQVTHEAAGKRDDG
jgi:3',5'-cyclic AMP phosphodiesterase CpdA